MRTRCLDGEHNLERNKLKTHEKGNAVHLRNDCCQRAFLSTNTARYDTCGHCVQRTSMVLKPSVRALDKSLVQASFLLSLSALAPS